MALTNPTITTGRTYAQFEEDFRATGTEGGKKYQGLGYLSNVEGTQRAFAVYVPADNEIIVYNG